MNIEQPIHSAHVTNNFEVQKKLIEEIASNDPLFAQSKSRGSAQDDCNSDAAIAGSRAVSTDSCSSTTALPATVDDDSIASVDERAVDAQAFKEADAVKLQPNGKLAAINWPVTTLRPRGKDFIETPDPVFDNVRYLLNEYKVLVRYNELKRKPEIKIPDIEYNEDNRRERNRGKVLDLVILNGLRMPESRVDEAIQQVADKNAFHPVRDWIDSIAWDGVSRLNEFFATLEVAPRFEAHRNAMVRRWLISAVAALYRHSRETVTKYEGCLVLQGAQNAGKTSWYASLTPADTMAIKTSFKLVPSNKDHIFTLASHWIVELGELDSTFSASEMGSLKAFMSDTVDCQRRAYGREDSELTRQTIMGASVNKPDYLVDDTGNRRWWTVPVTSVNARHGIDMQQVWAEVKLLFMNGEQWWLTEQEMNGLTMVNREFGAIVPVKELITATFEFDRMAHQMSLVGSELKKDVRQRVRLTVTEIVMLVGLRADDRKTIGECGRALRELTGGEPDSSNGRDVWRLIPREDSVHYAELKTIIARQNGYAKRKKVS